MVFAKSPEPSDQCKLIRLAQAWSMISSFVGLVCLGAFAFKPPRVEKSLRELSRGSFEALVGGASVSVKYQNGKNELDRLVF